MKGNRWDDHYARRARDEKWLARSVYKLQEIDKRFGLIHKGNRLLDLGCYPGSWSQYGIEKVGPEGEVFGIDQVAPDRFSAPNFRFIPADVLTLDLSWLREEVGPIDTVMSDLAPRTTGVKSMDAARSVALARRAATIAQALLRIHGNFLCKVFEGEEVKEFRSEISASYRQVRTFRPLAVRRKSREEYVVALGFGK
jgi:23S rRNA (uridine2552-2'-O)-methyltransferase